MNLILRVVPQGLFYRVSSTISNLQTRTEIIFEAVTLEAVNSHQAIYFHLSNSVSFISGEIYGGS